MMIVNLFVKKLYNVSTTHKKIFLIFHVFKYCSHVWYFVAGFNLKLLDCDLNNIRFFLFDIFKKER